MRTAGLDDKYTACQMLVVYARDLGEGFADYIEAVSGVCVCVCVCMGGCVCVCISVYVCLYVSVYVYVQYACQ